MSARRFALALGALAACGAMAQEPADGTREDRRRELAARVARLRGRALVQAPGAGGWTEMPADGTLAAGDRVRATGGPIELVLPPAGAQEADLSTDGGDRVVLAPDARVTLAPEGTDARLRLDEGGCFAAGTDGLRVQAGGTTVTVRGGDAELELSRTGALTVTVHSGRVDVDPTGEQPGRALKEGERLSVTARGAPVVRTTRPRRPDYVVAVERVDPDRVVFAELFREWPDPYRRARGDAFPEEREREGHLLSTGRWSLSADPPPPEDRRAEVHFGRGADAGGLWDHVEGARLRLRYRLSAPAPLQVRLRCSTNGEFPVFLSGPVPGRAGAWDELEVRPEHLRAERGERRLAAGERVTYLTVLAGTFEGPTPRLELARVLVYTARP
ncbi:MAG: hypothetical protein M9894_07300 [Planctomycetes bacterium]|nr:hypothetical protein [Planctomycetota bacterium]